jgi:gliding motility-associated-like protein
VRRKIYIAVLLILSVTINLYSQVNSLYVGKACLVNPSDPPPTAGTSGCYEPNHFFDALVNTSADNWSWDFGDGSGVIDFLGRNPKPSLNYIAGNTYTVTVTAKSGTTIVNQDSRTVDVGYYPKQPMFENKLRADTTICGGSSITLDPYDGMFSSPPAGVSYKWFPGGQPTRTIEVDEPGCYTVEVIDDFSGCSRFATITVKVCYEQKSSSGGAEKWYFGHGSGLEFTLTGRDSLQSPLDSAGSLNPQPILADPTYNPSLPRDNDNFEADEATAVVLDKGNAVVLYSDGKKIFAGEDDSEIPLAGSTTPFTINKDVGAQGIAIIPKPICNACDFIYYYVFTVDETTGLLSYSVVDMRDEDNNPKGAVIESDIPIAVNMTGKITVERGADDESFVIYAFDKNSNTFQSFAVDSVGITASPPTLFTAPITEQSAGYVTISPDQSTLAHAMIINGENVVILMSIDRNTNQLTETARVNLGTDPASIYGLAFSPNGNLLYVTLQGNGGSIPSKLLQLNISSGDATQIAASSKLVASGTNKFGAVSLGPKYGDGAKYVYVTMEGTNVIHRLQSPNEIITTADPSIVGFTLQTGGATAVAGNPKLGFPNVAAPQREDEGSGTGATYTGNCLNATTWLNIQTICDPYDNEVEWTVEGQKKKGQQIEHIFSREGWHEIYISIEVRKPGITVSGVKIPGDRCYIHLDTGRIYIKPAPKLNVPDPLYVCTDDLYYTVYKPEPTEGDSFSYNWYVSNGIDEIEDTRNLDPRPDSYRFKLRGDYVLKVTNHPYSCSATFPIRVEIACLPQVHAPNVITPNNDGNNDKFKIFSLFIERPTLEIYNRWGDQIFQTDDLENDLWDGTYKNRPAPSNQLYAYIIRYFSRDFPERGEQRQVGSVLILRD